MIKIYIKAEKEIYSLLNMHIMNMAKRENINCLCKAFSSLDVIEEKGLVIYQVCDDVRDLQSLAIEICKEKGELIFITKDELVSRKELLYKVKKIYCYDIKKEFSNLLNEIKKSLIIRNSCIRYTSGFMDFEIHPAHIVYIESYHHDLYIHTDLVKLRIRDSLKKYCMENEFVHLIQIHKSFIVNLCCVKEIRTHTILLNNGEELPIGKRYENALNTCLANYMK
ncbi:LytTR family DNA-binding domain-containing protein [Amedibacillus sp. YH-ame10]